MAVGKGRLEILTGSGSDQLATGRNSGGPLRAAERLGRLARAVHGGDLAAKQAGHFRMAGLLGQVGGAPRLRFLDLGQPLPGQLQDVSGLRTPLLEVGDLPAHLADDRVFVLQRGRLGIGPCREQHLHCFALAGRGGGPQGRLQPFGGDVGQQEPDRAGVAAAGRDGEGALVP